MVPRRPSGPPLSFNISAKNRDGETLGDINNVILNEKGNVVAATIGVGGFLGIGEEDVGVPFDNIDFRASEICG